MGYVDVDGMQGKVSDDEGVWVVDQVQLIIKQDFLQLNEFRALK